jgi:hypothetical protein
MATRGAAHNQYTIQRAAAMRVTRQAHGSNGPEITQPTAHMASFAPLAESRHRSRSYADFVTDVELHQARVEMDECYRRRARRVGLEDTLPAGRLMTEEEIEDLQWQLGDFGPAAGYGSRGKKRRTQQDVIDMTIEEMEAELKETNEAIRQRRKKHPGLMIKPLWMLTIVSCLALQPARAFTAYDCTNRSNVVEAYSLLEPDACASSSRDGEVETTVFGEILSADQAG